MGLKEHWLRDLILIALGALFVLAVSGSSHGEEQKGGLLPEHRVILQKATGCTGDEPVCGIDMNYGGVLEDFLHATWVIIGYDLNIAVLGECGSSCELLMEWAAGHVCMSEKATLIFHQGWQPTEKKYIPNRHIYPIQKWIDQHGGEPTTLERRAMLEMSGADALATGVWRHCEIESGKLVLKD
ncbi:hypothetical protein FJY93_02960 [Candidatus Kaiserbacteria bacterium]|nr:hypothetical protein [Candidatus Kaiserbacteria bacterium]